MSQKYVYQVSDASQHPTLHRFLSDKLASVISGKQIKKAIESGQCTINGRIEKFGSTLLVLNDKIELFISEKKVAQPLRVLFENEDFLALDKWAGLVCEDSVIHQFFPGNFLIHRLDKETTGVLLIAKREEVKKWFITQFREGKILKTYLALCNGKPKKEKGIIRNFLVKQGTFKGQTLWKGSSEGPGLSAETHWKVIKSTPKGTLIECHPITGRTHQLRVHLKELGCPIIGDVLYNKDHGISSRMMLHAWKLEIPSLNIVIESLNTF